jgi:hypothetical protein
MSFNYPSNFQNSTSTGDIISGSKSWVTVANLANSDGVAIMAQKNSLSSLTPATSITATELSVKTNNGIILSTTTTTNPNGVEISGSITTLLDPSTNSMLRYYDMAFTANGQIYSISVFGKDSDNSKILEVKNTVFNSINAS